ncbi:MAG: glycosyltransferase family 4 protein [Oculatellaceae cyanobacterium bins.114]|nr:glycosyltransferase family 4 protein [Oculatellaceae cyanobacterium bins.114]
MKPSRPLRILFLASYFPKPDNPLMGTWALAQAQALARQDIELLVVSCTSWVPQILAITPGAKAYSHCPEEFTWVGSVRVRYPRWLYYPVAPLKVWAYANPTPYLHLAWASVKREFCQIVGEFQPDVIFCHHLLPNGWIAAQLPHVLRRPLVTLDHDFDEITDCHRYPQRRAAMQSAITGCQVSLTVSKRMEQDLRALFPNHPILTHHNGVELPPVALFAQQRPPELKNKKVVLSCALFAERKGIPLLIEAFCRIADRHPDAVLRIIGGGPEERNVIDAIQRYDQNQQVQLLGKKLHPEVLQEMVWADCFALVGWDEPFATVYLEAMAAGKPIICCQDGGINDVFCHELHGYAVAPRQVADTSRALDRMLSHDAKRVEMGKQAQQFVQQYLTWDAKATQLVELFSKVILTTDE